MSENESVIIFPEFEILKNQAEKLRTELSMLLSERDELQFVICKNLEMEYLLKFGSLEYRAYQAQCNALRLKRKIELIQAKKNRRELVNLSLIEQQLDDEFALYQKELESKLNQMNAAIERSQSKVLSEEETKELKKLYRGIVKVLHPDMNPNVTEAGLNLLERAVTAYKNGDLQTLRIIHETVGGMPLPKQRKNAMVQLTEEKERLQGLLQSVKQSIEKIKSEYPYNQKELLRDAAKTEAKKQELSKLIQQYESMVAAYQQKIEEMLR